MTFLMPAADDRSATVIDEIEEELKIHKKVPKGWVWFPNFVFKSRARAITFMNEYLEHRSSCDHRGCETLMEAKVIKRGTQYLVVERRKPHVDEECA